MSAAENLKAARESADGGKPLKLCDKKGCTAPAELQIGVSFTADPRVYPGADDEGKRMRCIMGLYLCTGHAQETRPDDLLSDAGKRVIEQGVATQNLAAPWWPSARVEVWRMRP